MSTHYAEIVRLAHDRVRPVDIAHRLSIPVATVYADIKKARCLGVDIPPFTRWNKKAKTADDDAPSAPGPTSSCAISVPVRLHSILLSEAEKRGKTTTELAQSILEAGLLKAWSADV